MFGEQYELWGVDEAPLPAEIAASAPLLVPVSCRLCQTLMYARPDQVGTSLSCPDCGAKTVVKSAAAAVRQGPQPVALGEEYQIDEASAPGPRPAPREAAVLAQAEQLASERDVQRKDEGRRRKRPRPPLITEVLPMLFSTAVVARWLTLSAALTMIGWFAAYGLSSGQGGGMGAIAQVCFLALATMLGGMWLVAASAIWLAILTESAEGHRRLDNPPTANFLEWFGETFYVMISAAVALYRLGRRSVSRRPVRRGRGRSPLARGWRVFRWRCFRRWRKIRRWA